MNRRMIIMLVLLGLLMPVALYRVYSSIWGGRRSASSVRRYAAPPPVATPAPSAEEQDAEETASEARPFHPVPVETDSFKRLVASKEWGRNPFLTLDELYQPKNKAAVTKTLKVAPGTITLTSVLVSGEDGVAVINGEFYLVGDILPMIGETVVAITGDGVVLEGPKGRRLLAIAQSDIPLTSREVE